ncbi:MAG: hypothetical protein O7F73_06635 [Gammaproteobacteria bacterium]|nr:hypothetical protein [Gammaproteobacteria bacterium]
MGQHPNEPTVSDSIDEIFEPVLGDATEDAPEADKPHASGKSRLAELRRRAEQRLEDKRIQDELGYMDLDGEEA